jgi:hypothetical protein
MISFLNHKEWASTCTFLYLFEGHSSWAYIYTISWGKGGEFHKFVGEGDLIVYTLYSKYGLNQALSKDVSPTKTQSHLGI